DGQSGDLGQVSYDVFGDAVREILLLWIAAHVVERGYGDRWLCSSGRARLSRRGDRLGGSRPKRHGVHSHRPFDVLQRMLAYILEGEIEPIADLVPHHGGHRNAAWLGDALDPRRDIDAVAIDVTVLEDDVADIHPYAELDPPLFRHIGVPLAHLVLDFRCAGHRVHHA